MKNIAILAFDDMEEMDAIGPYEVFGVAASLRKDFCRPLLVAQSQEPVRCVHGLRVLSDYDFDTAPAVDVLLVPGGQGSRAQQHNEVLLDWVRRTAEHSVINSSVCTGVRITLAAGVARDRCITTHHTAVDEIRSAGLAKQVIVGKRFVRDGNYMSSAGISAGIDMALWMVEQWGGVELAAGVREEMEYF